MEKICEVDRLRVTARESWETTWETKILHQADLEVGSNIRLRGFMATFPSEFESEFVHL